MELLVFPFILLFYYCFKLHTFQSIQELTKVVKQLKQEVESQENLDEKRSL